jgi:uncharacterized protein (DUF433 family)
MNWESHIASNPQIMFGKPCIKGTRIPVDLILEKLANRISIDDLLMAYPRITELDVQACLFFASEAIKNELVHAHAA